VDLSAPVVAPVGGRTQWGAGGPPPAGAAEVRAPAGVVAYEPADMTVTVGAGTTVAELDALLAAHGQEVPLDPQAPDATVGGVLACGLSGLRRLRHGPVRDHLLEVRLVTGDGAEVTGGGPTVKNVTGYDIPRLFVGSFGTLGVCTRVTLRCRPRPRASRWVIAAPGMVCHRPAAWLWDGGREMVLLEGSTTDVDAQAGACATLGAAPALPAGAHRGRISVAPGRVRAVGAALDAAIGRGAWCAELGVGTVHVAGAAPEVLARARAVAHDHGGWMLREAGGDPADDGFGRPLPNRALMRRIKDAFDPDHRCNPGRLPL